MFLSSDESHDEILPIDEVTSPDDKDAEESTVEAELEGLTEEEDYNPWPIAPDGMYD